MSSRNGGNRLRRPAGRTVRTAAAGVVAVLSLLVAATAGAGPDTDPPVDEPSAAVPAAAATAPPPVATSTARGAIRTSLEDLVTRSAAVNRAYEPFRRRIPADPAAWEGMQALHDALAEVAGTSLQLRDRARALQAQAGFQPAVRRGELRRRLAAVDSLAAAAGRAAARDWRGQLPDDPEEARLRLGVLAGQTKTLADRTVAAANELAYALDVTEGVNTRSLNLSLIGIIVVFAVLSLIAGVVSSVRRLDDRWQLQEQEHARAASRKEPTIDSTTLVLIAAACTTVVAGRFRIRRIRRLLSPATKRTPWSAQGRLILQGSHDIGRKHV